jgi:hypothetical protein
MKELYDDPKTVARQMIATYGSRAPITAGERLNECLDQGDKYGRDYWVQVVYQVHRLQRESDDPISWGSGSVTLRYRSPLTRSNFRG